MKAGLRSCACAVVAAALAALPGASASAGTAAATQAPPKPLPAPPTVPLIRVEVARDHVLVVEDVLLRRGDGALGDVDLFVAFGSPGVPRALDARLYGSADDDDAVPPPESFTAVPVDRAFRRPGRARLLVGPPTMAGAVLHLRDPWLGRALAATGLARLRVRTLIDPPAADAAGAREVLVRLGSHLGEPYALGAVEVVSTDAHLAIEGRSARLCGPSADPYPLAVRGGPASATPPLLAPAAPIAPVLSVRHTTDDLCVRYVAASRP